MSFNINDIDGDALVKVTAYDAAGDAIVVDLTGGNGITLLDTDAVAGADTADSDGGYGNTNSGRYTLAVNIAGPVARIEVEHTQNGWANSGVNITDIYFDNPILNQSVNNDVIDGGIGNDVIYGAEGADTIDGGAGDDMVSGDAGHDTAIYNMAENTGATDRYDGGRGIDTLLLELTNDEWQRANVQADIAAFLDFVAANTLPSGEANTNDFSFTGFDLTARAFENLRVTVDGVTLDPADQAVIASDDAYGIGEDAGNTVFAGSVLGNNDVPDLVKTVTLVSGPAKGILTFNADGTFAYDPSGAFEDLPEGVTEEVTFEYEVTDADGDTDQATVTIAITGANDGATITGVNTGGVTEDDAPATLTTQGSLGVADVDQGEAVFVQQTDTPGTYGSFAITADGSWNYSADNMQSAIQSLPVGGTLTEVFTASSLDGTASETVTITITGTNDSPVITTAMGDDAGEVTEAGNLDSGEPTGGIRSASGMLSASDVDAGATAVWTIAADATNTTTLGAMSIDEANGEWVYLLDQTFADDLTEGVSVTETFTATVTDDQNATATQTVTVTITGTNDAPIVTAALAADTAEDDASFTINLLEGATDVDAGETGTLSVQNVSGLVAGVTLSGNTLSVDPADANFQSLALNETRDIIVTYEVVDAQGAIAQQTVTITLTGTNDAPVVTSTAADAAGTVVEAGSLDTGGSDAGVPSVTGTLTSSDVDTGATAAWSGDATGTYGSFAIDEDTGQWTYTLDQVTADGLAEGASETETFTATVTDDQGATATETVAITVIGTKDAPVVAAALAANAVEDDASFTMDLLAGASDMDTGETATLSVQNMSGLVDGMTLSGNTLSVDPSDASFQSLAVGEQRVIAVAYEVADAQGATVDQTATIVITGTNDAPMIDVAASDLREHDSQGTIVFTDVDISDVHTVQIDEVRFVGNANGLTDAQARDLLTFSINSTTALAAGSADWAFAISDFDAVYLAEGEAFAVEYDFTIADGNGGADEETVQINFTGVNDAPTALDDVNAGAALVEQGFGVAGNATATGSLLDNDSDPDTTDVLRVTNVDAGTGEAGSNMPVTELAEQIVLGKYGSLTIAATGAWTYTLNNADADTDALEDGETGLETFTYTLSDGNSGTDTATLTLEIAGAGDNVAPVAVDDAFSVAEDTPTTLDLLGNDTDANNVLTVTQQLSVLSINGTAAVEGQVIATINGSINIGANGSIEYTPNGDYSGSDSFTYVATDGLEASNGASVSLTIDAVADAPIVELVVPEGPTDPSPQVIGNDIRLNTVTDGQQRYASVTELANGDLMTVWASSGSDSVAWDIIAQRLAADGTPSDGPFTVNTTTVDTQWFPSVAALNDGGFVVSWTDVQRSPSNDVSIAQQRFDAESNPVGTEMLFATQQSGGLGNATTAALPDGGWLVVWTSSTIDGDGQGVSMQRFDANGAFVGTETRVNSYVSNSQGAPDVAVAGDGSFVVTWQSNGQDGSGQGIYAQRYDPSSAPVGTEFQVNTETSSTQADPSVAILANGSFVIAWGSFGQDGDDYGIYAQTYDANGAAVGGEMLVSDDTVSGRQNYPTVLALSDGGYLVSWSDRSFGTEFRYGDVIGQRFDAAGTAVGEPTILHQITSGGVSKLCWRGGLKRAAA